MTTQELNSLCISHLNTNLNSRVLLNLKLVFILFYWIVLDRLWPRHPNSFVINFVIKIYPKDLKSCKILYCTCNARFKGDKGGRDNEQDHKNAFFILTIPGIDY
jgi:hypothetical protein